jgi:hypothetical protein
MNVIDTLSPDLDGNYKFRFMYTSTADSFKMNTQSWLKGTKKYGNISLSNSGGAIQLTVTPTESGTISNLRIDNVSLQRTVNLKLRLLLCPQQTLPVLVSGVYAFSVWVHPDPAASAALDSFTVTMSPTGTSSLFASPATYTTSSGWTKVRATLSGNALQFSEQTTTVLELVIDCNSCSPGSVLLAQPELRFYPNGL